MEKQKILSDLIKFIPKENIKLDEPMSKHTSFKTGGNADFFIFLDKENQIEELVKYSNQNNIDLYVIGNGSNLLISDQGIRGIVAKVAFEDIVIEKDLDGYTVNVGAGCKVMTLAQFLKRKEITGFEEFSGIPGTIGGANYMNAGAYGKEMKDIIIKTRVFNKENGKIEILSNEEQKLQYRGSIFNNKKFIILDTTFRMQGGTAEKIEEKMNECLKQRKEKQPIEYPSAGSTFKRGDGFMTAKLIDECGLKGFQIGGAQISEKHAGFIINKDNATTKDIIDLIEYTKKKVFEKFGVQIEEEVEII